MDIEIDAQSRLTITEQIVGQIERLISEGELKEDDVLPAVKDMADRLQISRMTTAKAYALLCEKGLAEQSDGRFSIRVKK
ncbi:GntR family transcriptional regulator [Ruminococcus albus]|uniref:GntR family transcriptional regulator n=1 Tax=Ruminococcus albus TaxID=1264 RepID=UPI00046650A3|nr:winged helix-turn-helix domain-containing protein [Ruminococcus albus]MBP5267151.1 winged helix-turn-helix transcriptional regulator [Ruminococcus sp.]